MTTWRRSQRSSATAAKSTPTALRRNGTEHLRIFFDMSAAARPRLRQDKHHAPGSPVSTAPTWRTDAAEPYRHAADDALARQPARRPSQRTDGRVLCATRGRGLIVSEGTYIAPLGKGYAWTPGIHTPSQVAGWRKVTDAVHAAGGRIFAQLWHVGRLSHTSLLGGQPPLSSSPVQAVGVMCSSQAKTAAHRDSSRHPCHAR